MEDFLNKINQEIDNNEKYIKNISNKLSLIPYLNLSDMCESLNNIDYKNEFSNWLDKNIDNNFDLELPSKLSKISVEPINIDYEYSQLKEINDKILISYSQVEGLRELLNDIGADNSQTDIYKTNISNYENELYNNLYEKWCDEYKISTENNENNNDNDNDSRIEELENENYELGLKLASKEKKYNDLLDKIEKKKKKKSDN